MTNTYKRFEPNSRRLIDGRSGKTPLSSVPVVARSKPLASSEVSYREDVCARLVLVLQVLEFTKGLTQREIADRIGVSPTRLSNWTTGAVFPNAFALYKLCRAYGVTADYLYQDVVSGLPRWLVDGLEAVSRERREASPVG